MNKLKRFWKHNSWLVIGIIFAFISVGLLLVYRLGTLTHGLSEGEIQTARVPVGWHGIYHSPLELPVKIVRSLIFYIDPKHGQTLTRLPNAVFGAFSIISFGWLTYLWHGRRTAIISTVLFACSAWLLHVSRFASNDIMYFWATTTLLLLHTLLQRFSKNRFIWLGTLALWGILLTIPGIVWFILVDLYLQRGIIKTTLSEIKSWWQRLLTITLPLLWVPLIVVDLGRPHELLTWLGLPAHLPGMETVLKQFGAVFVHLFIRGPEYPTIWLGRSPIFDALTLTMAALGLYFYARRWQTTRSHLLGAFFLIGFILVGLGGPVGLSILVPLVYALAAMGIAYLLHEWLKVFPINPLARGAGIGLVTLAVAVSCIYNVRAYFIAWPHSPATQATFIYHR